MTELRIILTALVVALLAACIGGIIVWHGGEGDSDKAKAALESAEATTAGKLSAWWKRLRGK